MAPMTRWDDRRAYLRRRAISALYPLSRLWPGSYEQPELWVSDALRTCYVVNPKVACSSIQVALTEVATGQAVQGFRHNHPAVLAFRRTSFRSRAGGIFLLHLRAPPGRPGDLLLQGQVPAPEAGGQGLRIWRLSRRDIQRGRQLRGCLRGDRPHPRPPGGPAFRIPELLARPASAGPGWTMSGISKAWPWTGRRSAGGSAGRWRSRS